MSGLLRMIPNDLRYTVASCLNCIDNYSTMQICNNVSNFDKIYKLVLLYLQWHYIL